MPPPDAPITIGKASAEAMAPIAEEGPAPISELVAAVNIPHEMFMLDNGLRVIVHEDRKAPVVAVSVWYNVGSKHEPKGKTGFAHLFEHLMFSGSENAPGDFFEPLEQIGATDLNGTTWYDRTNYYETVPTGALDRTLMLESDRMGYLLGAVTQEKLDNQIGVVQNEKRQGDNRAYGLVAYEQLENLYPSGHPYHHSTIGSMADLSSATLDDVKDWFRANYGPNNAILVLAGDIDLPTARRMVTKWFGAIPSGPSVTPVSAPVPDLPAPVSKTIYDEVSATRVHRMWAIPGYDSSDYLALSMGATVLGRLASSRLEKALVREKQVAVRASARAEIFAQGGQMVISADARSGVTTEQLGAAIDVEIADFLATGPTADELQRATTTYAARQIRGLESVGGEGGKAPTLAQGLLLSGNAAQYKVDLEAAAVMTPDTVKAAMNKWLSRPVFELIVEPGPRKEGGEARGGFRAGVGAEAKQPSYYRKPARADEGATARAAPEADRSKLPPVTEFKPLEFPAIERATLSNGMRVFFVHRDAVPVVSVRLVFDAGYAADPVEASGTQSLMLRMMGEGTTNLNATEQAEARERLGASILAGASEDTTSFQLDALVPSLAPSLDLLADYIRNPAFEPEDLERVRAQQLNQVQRELKSPAAISQRTMAKVLYGDRHPYGMPPSGVGDEAVVAALGREELVAFHQQWISPSQGKIMVVGDTTLQEVLPLLEERFGQWETPAGPAPIKDYSAPLPIPEKRIILIDRPGRAQTMIVVGRTLPFKGSDDLISLEAANDILGGGFLSRINLNLRETKGWSYGVLSLIRSPQQSSSFVIFAPVQADRTGDSITLMLDEIEAFTTDKGVTAEELELLVNSNVRKLPGRFETSGSVLAGLVDIVTFDRPDDYYETLAGKYQSLTVEELDRVGRAAFKQDDLVFVVVGDRSEIEPQLADIGLPVEVIPARED